MPPRKAIDLLSLPSALRPIFLRPLPPQAYSRAWARDSSTSGASIASFQQLWNERSLSLSLEAEPALDRSPHPELGFSSEFFAKPPPSFAYSAPTFQTQRRNLHVPEVCVLGCSNVGKSTLVGAVLGQPGIARVGARPGFTIAMNAYMCGPVTKRRVAKAAPAVGGGREHGEKKTTDMDVDRALCLMDTPGYGFKSVSAWGENIGLYLERRPMLRGVLLLLRADVPLTRTDRAVLGLLADASKPTSIVLTRADRCGADWRRVCEERATEIWTATRKLTWKAGAPPADVWLTAAGMQGSKSMKGLRKPPKTEGADAGVGGARLAVLKLAGLVGEEAREEKPEGWVGKVISWDDLQAGSSA